MLRNNLLETKIDSHAKVKQAAVFLKDLLDLNVDEKTFLSYCKTLKNNGAYFINDFAEVRALMFELIKRNYESSVRFFLKSNIGCYHRFGRWFAHDAGFTDKNAMSYWGFDDKPVNPGGRLTPLMTAIYHGQDSIMQLLLGCRSIDVNQKSKATKECGSETPLSLAIKINNKNAIDLLEHDARTKLKNLHK